MIDFELTDEQKLIRDTAREFADNEIAPRARENDRAERFDHELVAKMAELGFIGPILPEEYGGRGHRLPHLRADRGGDRARGLLRAHRGLGVAPRCSARPSPAGAPRSRSSGSSPG